ncbi:MAG: hypothetical protein MK212_10030 [Saprospiraceae bacterium]|nr:hypothetical protein [Saprospiraceae bacterium]
MSKNNKMTILKNVLVYAPAMIFTAIRMPVYMSGQGFIWYDAVIAGVLASLGAVIYQTIEKKQQGEETEEDKEQKVNPNDENQKASDL